MRHMLNYLLCAILLVLAGCSADTQDPLVPFQIEVEFTTDKPSYETGEAITIEIKNVSTKEIHVWAECPPFLERKDVSNWEQNRINNRPCLAIAAHTSPLERGESITIYISADESSEFLAAGIYRKSYCVSKEAMGEVEIFYSDPIEIGPTTAR